MKTKYSAWLFVSVLCAWTPAAAFSADPSTIKGQLDVTPKPKQKPYSPADGQSVAVTPPPFIWIPVKGVPAYVLQVSRSKDFDESDTQTFRDIRTSVFVPREALPVGQWFWRYGVQTGDGDVLGRPRPFNVPADAKSFPFPDFDQVIARVPKKRPRLVFPREYLTRIRKATRGKLQKDVAALVADCRKVIDEELVAEPPRPKTGPERVTVMRTTRPPMDWMEHCALAYLLTGDESLGQEAKRRLLHFFSWDPKGPTCLWSYDEPAMWVMMRGIRAYDWTYDLFTSQEREQIEPVMKERTRQFYVHLKQKRRFETDPYESHAGRMPGFLGEAALCFAHEWPEAKPWLEYATLLYYTSYPAWGGDDGGWQEGPSYWTAYMYFALHYVVALRNATGVDLMNKPFFRNTPYHALYMATPYHQYGHFGDGSNKSPRFIGTVMYAFSSLSNDPYLRWLFEQCDRPVGRDLLTLATYNPDLRPGNPEDLPHGRAFPSAGLAAIHTDLGDKDRDISFLIRSSPFGSVSHGHADQNAFVIEAYGRALAMATGYYPWYSSPHHHEWTRATKSVNSILVNGEGQVRRSWDAKGSITAFKIGDGYDYVEAEAGQAYGDRLKRFRRHVVHVQPGTFVMFDDLMPTKPSTFQWLLHAFNRIEVAGNKMTVRNGPAEMIVYLLKPSEIKITQHDRYDPEPEQQKHKPIKARSTWHLTASTTEPSETARFLTVFCVYRKGEKPSVSSVQLAKGEGAIGVVLTDEDGTTDIVAFRIDPEADQVSCSRLESTGRVFAEGRDASGKKIRKLAIPR